MNAETNLIGCLFLTDHAPEIFSITSAEDFEDMLLSTVFSSARQYWQEHNVCDAATATTFTTEQMQIALECMNTVQTVSGWKTYAEAVRNNSIRRKAQTVLTSAVFEDMPLDDMRQTVENANAILTQTVSQKAYSLKSCISAFVNRIGKGKKEYIPTGYTMLDRELLIDRGDYIIIGGRPSNGKTALALNIGMNMAKCGRRVLFFSLETSEEKITNRIVAAQLGVPLAKIKTNDIQPGDINMQQLNILHKLPFYVVKTAAATVSKIQAEALRQKADVIIIDYLGLVNGTGESRYEKITQISIGLRQLAQATGITVLALSQLNRNSADTEPNLQDLRESGQIEQDADAVILCHLDKDKETSQINSFAAIIAKSKEGECGKIMLSFDGATQKITGVDYAH